MGPTTALRKALLVVLALGGCAAGPELADPASDAPERQAPAHAPFVQGASYAESLAMWRDARGLNAWIGARFEYDPARAMRLSENQRQGQGRIAILPPEAFFAAPRGVCVDLARFAVETLRAIDPDSRPGYVMIEFDPVTIAGNTLRRHWIASFEQDGQRYFFADSKRPGHIAGPYADIQAFMTDYARYRGRRIVAFRVLDSYERALRARAPRPASREGGGRP